MIKVREMIASDDYSQMTAKYSISFSDFLLLTNSKLGDYGIYRITKEGVQGIDVGALGSCTALEIDDIYSFYETAKLEFPTTAAKLSEWVKKQNREFELPDKFINAVNASEHDIVNNKKMPTVNIKEMWVTKAWELGNIYMNKWREAGYEPTKANIGLYIEGVFSSDQVYNSRKEVIDRATIIREALTGITGNKIGHKSKKPIPAGKAGKLPEK
jgi:hypothetical protein